MPRVLGGSQENGGDDDFDFVEDYMYRKHAS
jgi:hypothetical protein